MSTSITVGSSLKRVALLSNVLPSQSRALVRYMSRQECAPDKSKCGDASLGQSPCAPQNKKKKKDEKPKSMWYNPECCLDPCPDIQPRYDELYYRISDKAKRVYEQTWVECPKIFIAPRKICCYENIGLPPMKKRKKADCPKTACEEACPPKAAKCPRFRLPGCKKVRNPPKCFIIRTPTDCKKICTPYPSYSECLRDKPKPRRPSECRCLETPMMCEVWAELRRQLSIK